MVTLLADVMSDTGATAIDACTLNNALNIAQLIALVIVIRWLRRDDRDSWHRRF